MTAEIIGGNLERIEIKNEPIHTAFRLGFLMAKLNLVDGFFFDEEDNAPTIQGPSNGFQLINDLESYWFRKQNRINNV